MSPGRSTSGEAGFRQIEFLAALKPSRMNLSLANVSALLGRLGDPQRRYPSVLVAGTNGKGSVTTFVSSMLRAAGLRVGTFYSPHIVRLHERIRLDGEEIPSAEFDELIGRVRDTAARRGRGAVAPAARRPGAAAGGLRGGASGPRDAIPFTYFECLTAVAALYFFRSRVDVAVFEVGLGGRLDATNLVDAAVTVITGISLDHREHLGMTRGRILAEKLGIVRGGVPLVANLGSASLEAKARAWCRERGAPLHLVGEEVRAEAVDIAPSGMTVRLATPGRDYGRLETRMIGRAQVANLATAARVVELLIRRIPRPLGVRAVRAGARSAFLPGRFQTVREAPRVVVDVAHNEESLLASLDTLARVSSPRRSILVFAALAHKELGRFPRAALRSAREIIVTPLSDPRGASAEQLLGDFERARRGARAGRAIVRAARGVREAVRMAERAAGPEDTVVILGSHHTVDEAASSIR
jgi:dihydrofolate synthase/folylpolyglutamate synthase